MKETDKIIKQLKRMTDETISFKCPNDKTGVLVKAEICNAYKALCAAYNIAHGWRVKP